MKRIAILTGATGGLGKEFLKQILNENIDQVWAIARNKQKLSDLQKEYGEKIFPISLDLSDLNSIYQWKAMLEETKPLVSYLINNAGLAKMGRFNEFSLDEVDKTINVNCKAPVMLTQLCIPYMDKGSKIMNISSASAFQPNPYINLYASSKAFERHYSRAINVELAETGMTATAVCPGWIDTEMLQKEINGQKVNFPGLVSPEKVVTKAIKDAKKGKDMSVCSLYVKYQHLIVKLLPQRTIMKIWMTGIGKYLKES